MPVLLTARTLEPIHPLLQAIRAWSPADKDEAPAADTLELWNQSANQTWKAPELNLGDGRILAIESTEWGEDIEKICKMPLARKNSW
jgi:hypothetical protein